ncbi:hypothetical protein SAMN02910292_01540 [Lachnospiraceae bacterium XBB2008]|nr:hypothetical protein SAMN02910292_01540 [Lachnospiraceae bacterium XBB2008]
MSEKMLVTQALDERDLLVKKINDKIAKARFVDTIKPNEERVNGERVSRDDFTRAAESTFQQIIDLIERYNRIDAAIVASNAATRIQTSYGEFTVAGAISLRNRLREKPFKEDRCDFESLLQNELDRQYAVMVKFAEEKNFNLQETAENMRYSILGKDTKVKDDKPLEVVETYIRENTTELVDPLNVRKKIEGLQEKKQTLITELETQIKVSNATTFIEF